MDDVQTVQLRPGMYVGDTGDGAGLHNLLYAALDYAVAEVRAGIASRVAIDLYPDGSCTVADDGGGMPIAVTEEPTRAFPEVLLTQIHFGMMHIVKNKKKETIENTGLVPVNALSTWLDLRTVRDSIEYLVRFESGRLVRPLAPVPQSERRLPSGGTTISFLPNPRVFKPSGFDIETIRRSLLRVATTIGVVVILNDHRG
jgi:DNA gyrase subunit B